MACFQRSLFGELVLASAQHAFRTLIVNPRRISAVSQHVSLLSIKETEYRQHTHPPPSHRNEGSLATDKSSSRWSKFSNVISCLTSQVYAYNVNCIVWDTWIICVCVFNRRYDNLGVHSMLREGRTIETKKSRNKLDRLFKIVRLRNTIIFLCISTSTLMQIEILTIVTHTEKLV